MKKLSSVLSFSKVAYCHVSVVGNFVQYVLDSRDLSRNIDWRYGSPKWIEGLVCIVNTKACYELTYVWELTNHLESRIFLMIIEVVKK